MTSGFDAWRVILMHDVSGNFEI